MMKFLGIKRFAKKDGSGFCHTIQYCTSFSDREVQSGSSGLKVFEAFVDASVYDVVLPQVEKNLFKECAFDFVMTSSGKPDICNVRFLEPAAAPEGK